MLNFKVAITCFILCSCCGISNNTEVNNDKIKKNWINIEYLNCIHNNSPCKCQNSIKNTAIFLDSFYSMDIVRFEKEPVNYKIYNKNDMEKYIIQDNDTIKLLLNNNIDTLYLGQQTFVSNQKWEEYGSKFLDKLNGDVFLKKYGNIIGGIFSKNSIRIYCNQYLNAMIISNGRGCKSNYILEFSEDSIYIYDFLNSCEGKSLNWKINKKLLISFLR